MGKSCVCLCGWYRTNRGIVVCTTIHRTEVEAYCAVVSAFRAQGELTWKKAQLLQDLRQVLRVPEERHKMELKRVTDDETLAELAKLSTG